jgi:hypothetical protein
MPRPSPLPPFFDRMENARNRLFELYRSEPNPRIRLSPLRTQPAPSVALVQRYQIGYSGISELFPTSGHPNRQGRIVNMNSFFDPREEINSRRSGLTSSGLPSATDNAPMRPSQSAYNAMQRSFAENGPPRHEDRIVNTSSFFDPGEEIDPQPTKLRGLLTRSTMVSAPVGPSRTAALLATIYHTNRADRIPSRFLVRPGEDVGRSDVGVRNDRPSRPAQNAPSMLFPASNRPNRARIPISDRVFDSREWVGRSNDGAGIDTTASLAGTTQHARSISE